MHEVGLMQSAVELAVEAARQRGASRIHKLTLRVGRLAGVEPAALAFAFEAVVAGTPAEGAELVIEDVPATCACLDCGREFEPPDFIFRCPDCGALSSEVRQGRELELASLEVS
jgi:hydrogenase nickel incorporation protein HypA/HybF